MREPIPDGLLADPPTPEESTIADALAGRCAIIIGYRVRLCALRDWSAGGAGLCPDAAIRQITDDCAG